MTASFVVVLLLAPQFVFLPILTDVLVLAALFWFFRPAPTLLREDGIHASNAQANWDEILRWEIYDASRLLSLTVRSQLIRIDQLTIDVRLYRNQIEAERVLREHVPNGRVLPLGRRYPRRHMLAPSPCADDLRVRLVFRSPPKELGAVLVDCGPTIPTANRWTLRAMAFCAGAGGILYAFIDPLVAVFATTVTAPLWLPLLLLSLPRHTLLCEGGVATASDSGSWDEVGSWESYDAGKRLSLVLSKPSERLSEVSVSTRLTKNRDAALELLRTRVPNGRVLP